MSRPLGLPILAERYTPVHREHIDSFVVWDMKRDGALEPGFVDEFEGQDSIGRTLFRLEAVPGAILITIGGTVQRLGIAYARCGYGAQRPWWTCPKCGSTRGVLFLRARKWGCRGCMGLPYRSQRMSRLERAMAKAKRLHVFLGGSGNATQALPPARPHGMRVRTYTRKFMQYSQTVKLCNQLLHAKMEKILGRTVNSSEARDLDL